MNYSPHPYHRLNWLPPTSFIRWRGPDDVARRLHLQPHHPARLVFADEIHAVIDWVDVVDAAQYNGPFDPAWLEVTDAEQYHRAAQQLRTSDWPGFPWGVDDAMAAWAEQPWITGVEAFPVGARVRFAGDQRTADLLGLQPQHPGTVTSSGEKDACVDWIDTRGVFQHDGIMGPERLVAIDEDEYRRRADAVRRSGWPGFEAAGLDDVNHSEHDVEQPRQCPAPSSASGAR